MYKYCVLKTHNLNLLLSLLLSLSSLKISAIATLWVFSSHLDQYPAQPLSRQVMGPEVLLPLWITVAMSAPWYSGKECFRSQVACTSRRLYYWSIISDKVGFCLINGDWMLTHTWGALALQSLLALFGGASAKLASSHDVSSAQDDTFCQGLYWLRRALLRLKRLWVRRQRRDLDVLK